MIYVLATIPVFYTYSKFPYLVFPSYLCRVNKTQQGYDRFHTVRQPLRPHSVLQQR